MKVVILGQHPLNPKKIRGGVETCIIGLVNELKKYSNVEIHVITTEIMWKDVTKIVDNVTIHYLASPPLPRFTTINTIDRYRTIKKIKELKPDVVHAHMSSNGYYALKSGFPNVITIHGYVKDEYDPKVQPGLLGMIRRRAALPMEEYVFKHAKILTVLSFYTQKKIEPFCKGEIHIIPNGIERGWISIQNKEKEGRILFVGRISPIKRIEHLLHAVKKLKNNIKNVELHIVGNFNENISCYFDSLQKFIKENGLSENVKFMGALHGNDLKREYSECSVFVITSQIEAFPTVILEAMVSGKPVVATNVGGIPYLIKNRETGFLFEYGNINDLADKITNLLNNKKLRCKMGENGKKLAMKLDWKEIAKRYYDLYKKAIDDEKRK
ncbi:MAG: hypothetical protein CVT89_00145 [Candidatus Altiarchaeales archaeon HGW-Altiarchaeales-2]|nr:MAG: hypothetical protein CVT89_00145 [Candidatus Altiarchaeales archaeon HGW-Altiarchaeales-2]